MSMIEQGLLGGLEPLLVKIARQDYRNAEDEQSIKNLQETITLELLNLDQGVAVDELKFRVKMTLGQSPGFSPIRVDRLHEVSDTVGRTYKVDETDYSRIHVWNYNYPKRECQEQHDGYRGTEGVKHQVVTREEARGMEFTGFEVKKEIPRETTVFSAPQRLPARQKVAA